MSFYDGPDPDLTKLLFGIWSIFNVAVGVLTILFYWDASRMGGSTYDKTFRWASITMIISYFPPAAAFPFIYLTSSMVAYNIYYVSSYISIAGPLFFYNLVTYYFLLSESEGNSSGLYITNYLTYYLELAHIITF